MTFEVVIHQQAHSAIERNAVWWTEKHSAKQALEWQAAIYEQLQELQVMPKRHRLAREDHEFSFELRQQLLGTGKRPKYRAVFTIKESIVHVLDFLAAEQEDIQPGDL